MTGSEQTCPPAGKAGRLARARRAFTLVEVMMAGAVLTLALATAIIVLQIGFRNLDVARTGTSAAQVMQSEMERIRLLNWGQICALPASATLNVADVYASDSLEANRLTITRTVSDVAGFGTPSEIKEITLKAEWVSTDGQAHTRIFRLRYSKYGLFDYYYNAAQS